MSISESRAPSRFSGLQAAVVMIMGSRQAMLGAAVFSTLVIAAIFAPWIMPQDPYDLQTVSFMDGMLPPGTVGSAGFMHLLGTDAQGRDMLSAMVYGMRTSIVVALSATSIAAVIGILVGLTASFFGGRLEIVLMRVVEMQMGFPPLLFALVLVALLGSGIVNIIVAIVAVYWAYFARIISTSALVEREKQYVEACRCLALPTHRIMLRHILPNCISPLMVVAMIQLANAVQIEATLSFLGMGSSATEPSLGRLISNGYEYLLAGDYWISIYPGVLLMVLVLSLNLVGDRVRDALNPRLAR